MGHCRTGDQTRARARSEQRVRPLQLLTFLAIRGELRRAIDEGNEALRLDPANAVSYFVLIIEHTLAGQVDSAVTRFHQVQDLEPGEPLRSDPRYQAMLRTMRLPP